jgi:ribosomal protein L37AE/L43A
MSMTQRPKCVECGKPADVRITDWIAMCAKCGLKELKKQLTQRRA